MALINVKSAARKVRRTIPADLVKACEGLPTKAAGYRLLQEKGYTISEIAVAYGSRYQAVRNTLKGNGSK